MFRMGMVDGSEERQTSTEMARYIKVDVTRHSTESEESWRQTNTEIPL